jgi:beta-glucosidase
MKIFAIYLGALLLALLFIYGCGNTRHLKKSNTFQHKNNHTTITSEEINIKTKNLLSQMTLRQKAHEISGNGIGKSAMSMMFKGHASLVYMGGNKKLGIPTLSFADGPRGIGVAVATNFPSTMARGSSWNVDLENQIGEAMGIEARSAGANYSGAVCINVLRHPAWGRSQETYGEDPFLLGEMGLALMNGVQQHNAMACVKHFALNSIENNRFVVDVKVDERTLHEVYLPHFKKCIDNGAVTFMSAYNQVNGFYCAQNYNLLTEILRKQWGFKGIVSSDWMWGTRNTERSIKAGMNIEMPYAKYYKYAEVKQALKRGDITIQDIDDLVFPIIHTKLTWAARKDSIAYHQKLIASPQHIALARKAAEESAVLLQNKNQILPLQKEAVKRIAIVGSLAKTANDGDRASSKVASAYVVTPFDGIKNYVGNAVEILYAEAHEIEKIKSISKEADAVIIVAGYTYKEEGEFIHLKGHKATPGKKPLLTKLNIMSTGDRLSLQLPERDLKVIDAVSSVTDKSVVCIASGSAVVMETWKDKTAAILMTFYNGMEGGNALANLLFGEVNPSGKLPFTIPVHENDLPHFDPYCDTITYGYYHGYTLFDKTKNPVAFPFGYGLSYTQFSFSDLKIMTPEVDAENGTVEVSATVKNTGTKAGAEVAQLYIGFENTAIDRPVKLLRGFQKIFLQPQEQKTINFKVPVSELAYYNAETKTWQIEHMQHEVYVGNSSVIDSLLKGAFRVK